MRQVTNSVVVQAPSEALWDYLADYERSVKLASESAGGRFMDGTAGQAGARYEGFLEWEGITSRWVVRLKEADPPRSLTWESCSHGGDCWMRFDLQPDGNGVTSLSVTLAWGANKPNAPLEPFAWGLLTPMLRHAMRTLQDLDLG